jgi:hypothetical protein
MKAKFILALITVIVFFATHFTLGEAASFFITISLLALISLVYTIVGFAKGENKAKAIIMLAMFLALAGILAKALLDPEFIEELEFMTLT